MSGSRPPTCIAIVAMALFAGPAHAQRAAGWLQGDAFYHAVSNDFGDWKGVGIRAVLPSGPKNIWYGELVAQEAFNDRGVWVSAGNRHFFGPNWFTFASLGGGTGDYYLPDLRADASVGHAWLEKKNLVTILGATYVNSKDIYEDFALLGSVAAYFPGVTAEAGLRINWSNPDAVRTQRVWGAVTLGQERKRLIVIRGGGGSEGYQLTGDVETQQRFQSYEASIGWRQWLEGHTGFIAGLEVYHNPFYTRTGVTLGVFRHW
ncbi:MAG TPA: YaiO family outer membrane beta-barrel protein [Gemmatimonadales bacterium]|nr:YaiO family outer membrane beta-barrel protein [Gemmatimonadales bacterium]